MSKIRLQIESLEVESFDTVEAPQERGTVRGQEGTAQATWCGEESCDGTCATHCWGGGCEVDEHGPTVSDCTAFVYCG